VDLLEPKVEPEQMTTTMSHLRKPLFLKKTLNYSEPVTLTFVYVTAFGVVFMHVFGLFFFSLSGTRENQREVET
jgi:hypothetical protein